MRYETASISISGLNRPRLRKTCFQRYLKRASLAVAVDEPLERRPESQIIDRRWVQKVRNGPYLMTRRLNQCSALRKGLLRFRIGLIDTFPPEFADRQVQSGNILSDPVMHFPGDSSAFFRLCARRSSVGNRLSASSAALRSVMSSPELRVPMTRPSSSRNKVLRHRIKSFHAGARDDQVFDVR